VESVFSPSFTLTEKIFSTTQKIVFMCKNEEEKILWVDLLKKNKSDPANKKKNFMNKIKNNRLDNSLIINFNTKTRAPSMGSEFSKSGWMFKKGNFVKKYFLSI
jgi:hypothetical protein